MWYFRDPIKETYKLKCIYNALQTKDTMYRKSHYMLRNMHYIYNQRGQKVHTKVFLLNKTL